MYFTPVEWTVPFCVVVEFTVSRRVVSFIYLHVSILFIEIKHTQKQNNYDYLKFTFNNKSCFVFI